MTVRAVCFLARLGAGFDLCDGGSDGLVLVCISAPYLTFFSSWWSFAGFLSLFLVLQVASWFLCRCFPLIVIVSEYCANLLPLFRFSADVLAPFLLAARHKFLSFFLVGFFMGDPLVALGVAEVVEMDRLLLS